MPTRRIPAGLTTAALLKSQLDRGKDYFDLLLPFVERALDQSDSELVDPQQLRQAIAQACSLQLPLRTVVVLLDRLTRDKALRKESGRYLRLAGAARSASTGDGDALAAEFGPLGEAYTTFASSKGLAIESWIGALEQLASYLEENGAALLLGDRPSAKGLSRREEVVAATFIAEQLGNSGLLAAAINSLLHGLILRRAVLLSDLATLGRRLDGLVVYLDTPFLLSLVGLHGPLACEASKESCKVLKSLGAVPAAFDTTLAEMRRLLTVYENRLDTAAGRASLAYTPLTQYFFAAKATGAEVRERSALLEIQLSKQSVPIHPTPPRKAEYVDDEGALADVLRDTRGPQYTARADHDIDCVAAVLTMRQGATPTRLEDARAVFAASGRVVTSVMGWWNATEHVGIAPIIDHGALMNYCWLKKPAANSNMLRCELAALCSSTLKPSAEAWDGFGKELKRMVKDGIIDSDEAAALLVDNLAAKFLAEVEDEEALAPSSITDVIDRLRAQQRAEIDAQTTAHHTAANEQRANWEEQLHELTTAHEAVLGSQTAEYSSRLENLSGELSQERVRTQKLTDSVEGIASIVASLVSYSLTSLVVLFVVVIAVFPFLDATGLSPVLQRLAQALTVLIAVLGGVFGFAAVPWGRSIRNRIRQAVLARVVGEQEIVVSPASKTKIGAGTQDPDSELVPRHPNER